MSTMQVFVSHSHEDDTYCRGIVGALRNAGADVWYDEHNLGAGHLLDEITRELRARPVFVVILSKSAFASRWVKQECGWAFNLYNREPNRLILPVTAGPIAPADFNAMLYMEDFKRIEAPGLKPYPLDEVAGRLLHALALTAISEAPTVRMPLPTESVDELLERGRAFQAISNAL